MNIEQAKEILVLYRPETGDAEDATFGEALQLCERDPELKRWFENHCAVYRSLRRRFKDMPVPEGLKEQILAERKVHTTPTWRRPALVAVLGLVLVAALLSLSLFRSAPQPGLPVFADQMVGTALRGYGMELITNNPAAVRAFLQERQAPSDYTLPASLEKTAVIGCATLPWGKSRVSMICYKSDRRHAGENNDLWLFVADRASVPGAPATEPTLAKVNRAMTATWSSGGKLYLLVADGDEAFIRQFVTL